MSGTITFSTIPSNVRVPGVYFEIDASNANSGTLQQRTLILGQKTVDGHAISNHPILSTGLGDARINCGTGSMLSNMLGVYRRADAYGEVFLLPLDDATASTATEVSVLVVSGATEPGVLSLYIAGVLVSVPVLAGDIPSTIATNIAAAVAYYPDIPCTASVTANNVQLTARNTGESAGDLDVQLNYYGKRNGESTPAGVHVEISTVAGQGDPDPVLQIAAALANVSDDMAFDFIVFPYTHANALGAIADWLDDYSGRWSYSRDAKCGHAWTAKRGTVGQLQTWGTGNNCQHITCMGYDASPTPAYLVCADYCGVGAVSLRADPALPLQYLKMHTTLPPPQAARFSWSERQTMYFSGISCFKVSDTSEVVLERSVTQYLENAAGAPDDSYLDTEVLYTLTFLIRDLRNDLATKFARKKLLADDNARISYGQNFTTARIVKGEAVANYRRNADRGLCQNPDAYAANIRSENAGGGRVNLYCPFQLANQLRVIAISVAFDRP